MAYNAFQNGPRKVDVGWPLMSVPRGVLMTAEGLGSKSNSVIGHAPPPGFAWKISGKWPVPDKSDKWPETDQVAPQLAPLEQQQRKFPRNAGRQDLDV
jgi:hypothetical protein